MRFKNAVFSILMLTTTWCWGRTVDQIVCGQRNANWASFSIRDEFGDVVNLTYNYSSARLICPTDVMGRLERSGHLKCHGTWDWDFDRKTGAPLDTMAWISIQSRQGSFDGQFQTSAAYGSKIVKVKCQLEKVETKN